MSISRAAEKLVSAFQARSPLRSGSLIVTVFGDTVAPRGGSVWVGSLIRALEGFGINERLVRTSVFRLTGDGWLRSNTVGRRSFYDLTDDGRQELDQASTRIYGEPRKGWNGTWSLVLLAGVAADRRELARRELQAIGFGLVSASVLAHPDPDPLLQAAALKNSGAEAAVAIEGHTASAEEDRRLRALADKAWNIADVERRYRHFVDTFRPALSATGRGGVRDPDAAFRVRTLLIHEYRKIVLRDPGLPAELLPPDWPGLAAFRLCRNLYRATWLASEDYVTDILETAEGPVPPPAPAFYQRFGGLQ